MRYGHYYAKRNSANRPVSAYASGLVDADPAELRVLGCLIEKQRATPDAYPLSLNALRLACNQSTNRDPVVEYDEATVRGALERLGKRGWTRLASWSNRRAMKYRHLLDEALELSDADMALLCVLMLRGPQTPGELKARTERLHAFAPGEVEETLERLSGRDLVVALPRQPGQREGRWAQRLGEGGEEDGEPVEPPAPASAGLSERVDRLEEEVARLSGRLDELTG